MSYNKRSFSSNEQI